MITLFSEYCRKGQLLTSHRAINRNQNGNESNNDKEGLISFEDNQTPPPMIDETEKITIFDGIPIYFLNGASAKTKARFNELWNPIKL